MKAKVWERIVLSDIPGAGLGFPVTTIYNRRISSKADRVFDVFIDFIYTFLYTPIESL